MNRERLSHFETAAIATLLLDQASTLNGNKTPTVMDAGLGARETVSACMAELADRCTQNPALKHDTHLKPIIEAVKSLPDVFDAQAVAQAIKNIPLPCPPDAATQPKCNRFTITS